jgi:signal transduction histidine kinase/ActR/RegA family two-component response regulator
VFARWPTLYLRQKVAVLVMLSSLTAIGLGTYVAHMATAETLKKRYAAHAQSQAESLAALAEVPMLAGDRQELQRLADVAIAHWRVDLVRFFDAAGRQLVASVPVGSGNTERMSGIAPVVVAERGLGPDVFAESDLEHQGEGDRRVIGRVEVGISSGELAERLASQRAVFMWLTVGASGATALLAWFLVGGWTRRLDRLVDASDRIAQGQLDDPLTDARGDEIGQLSRSFEFMRRNLRQRDAQMRHFNERLQEEVRERTKELERAMHEAQAANRAKSDFLANMSHEIRTPMTAILGFAEVILDENLPRGERQSAVETIRRSGQHLLGVVNDILDLSKIEAGHMTVERLECAPASIIEDVASIMRVRAGAKGLNLIVDYSPGVPRTIRSDAMRVRQILLNLVGNAVKFTEKGHVAIRGSTDLARGVVRIDVEDTGIGIPPETIERIFQPFSQADETMTRRFGGTGLGLAIAKRFAIMLGGDVQASSVPGKGSRFTLTLPAETTDATDLVRAVVSEPPKRAEPEKMPDKPLVGVRVLVAEDGVDNQRLISHHLRNAGAEVLIVENGRLACEAVMTSPGGFDVILMDMQMPEMDGYTATSELRRRGCALPIIALTAHALVGDREKCLAAGCDDHVTKPVTKAQLLAACTKWVRKSENTEQRAA